MTRFPLLLKMAGEPDIVGKLKQVYETTGSQRHTYKVHLDGFDQSAFLLSMSGTAANNNTGKERTT